MHWKPALCQLYRRTLVPYLNQCRVDLTCRASGRRDSVNCWTRTDRLRQHRHVARRRTDKNAPKGQRMSSDLSGNYDRGTRRARLTPSLSETADFQRAPGDNADTARLRERIFAPPSQKSPSRTVGVRIRARRGPDGVRALDFRLRRLPGFNPRTFRFQVTTLRKLFASVAKQHCWYR